MDDGGGRGVRGPRPWWPLLVFPLPSPCYRPHDNTFVHSDYGHHAGDDAGDDCIALDSVVLKALLFSMPVYNTLLIIQLVRRGFKNGSGDGFLLVLLILMAMVMTMMPVLTVGCCGQF